MFESHCGFWLLNLLSEVVNLYWNLHYTFILGCFRTLLNHRINQQHQCVVSRELLFVEIFYFHLVTIQCTHYYHKSLCLLHTAGCLVILWQYFRILFLRSFPVRNVMNICPILNSYGTMDILNSRWFEPYVEHQGHSCLAALKIRWCRSSLLFMLHSFTTVFMKPHTWKSRGVRVWWLQWPILWTIPTSPLVRDLLIHVLHHMLTEM
jgi:hypothetical protein